VIELSTFERGGGETEGGRRAYRVQAEGLAVEREGEDLWVSMRLPKGSYATVVLGELMKRSP
jgi:tRNA pseudouridine13 synthase